MAEFWGGEASACRKNRTRDCLIEASRKSLVRLARDTTKINLPLYFVVGGHGIEPRTSCL